MSLLFVAVLILALSNFFVLASHADDMYGSACDDNLEALDKCVHGNFTCLCFGNNKNKTFFF